jgi:lysophospholipase L1-like esterase
MQAKSSPRCKRRPGPDTRLNLTPRSRESAPFWAIVGVVMAAIFGISAVSVRHIATSDQPVTLNDAPGTYVNAAFIGDSYTSGTGASEPQKRWTSLVSQKMGWIEHNFGRGGTGYRNTSLNGPNYLGMLDEVAASYPDIVVVGGGQNDLDRGAVNNQVSRAVADTYEELRRRLPNARIIAVGPSYGAITPSLIALDSDVQGAARAVGAEYISLIAPTPVLQPDMFIPPKLSHVNDSGHAAIADRITTTLSAG